MTSSLPPQSPPVLGVMAMAGVRTALAGVVEAWSVAHASVGGVGDAESAAPSAQGLGRALASVPGSDIGALFAEVARAKSLLEGLQVALLAEATSRGVVAESTATDPAAWARQQCREAGVALTPGDACAMRRAVELATPSPRLDARPLFDAVVTGTVPLVSARAVARELEVMAGKVTTEVFQTAAEELIGWAAQGGSASDLKRTAQAIVANYGEEAFEDEQAIAHRHREATTWAPDGAGGWAMTVRTDNEGRAVLDAAFDALAAPTPRSTVTDADGVVVDVVDVRTAGQRRHDALVELARVVATDPTLMASTRPASAVKAQVTVTMEFDRLAAATWSRLATTRRVSAGTAGAHVTDREPIGRGAGGAISHSTTSTGQTPPSTGYGLDGHGTPLTPSTVRRLACEAGIIPAVLDSEGAVLDWGRAKRLATPDQVAYLRNRDKGCAFPGCDRPPAWCEAHHLNEWDADVGTTDVNNLALLCSRHHTIVHAHHLKGQLRHESDAGRGRTEVTWTTRTHDRTLITA